MTRSITDLDNPDKYLSLTITLSVGCGVPEIKNGEVVDKPQMLSRDSAPYQTDDTVQVRCNEKYILQVVQLCEVFTYSL